MSPLKNRKNSFLSKFLLPFWPNLDILNGWDYSITQSLYTEIFKGDQWNGCTANRKTHGQKVRYLLWVEPTALLILTVKHDVVKNGLKVCGSVQSGLLGTSQAKMELVRESQQYASFIKLSRSSSGEVWMALLIIHEFYL